MPGAVKSARPRVMLIVIGIAALCMAVGRRVVPIVIGITVLCLMAGVQLPGCYSDTASLFALTPGPDAPAPGADHGGDRTADGADTGDDSAIEEKRGPRFRFGGTVKNLCLFHRTDNYLGEDPLSRTRKNLSADMTRLRLSPEFQYREILTMRLDLDNELIASNHGRSRDFTAAWRQSQYNDLLTLGWEPYRGAELYYRIKAHRATVKAAAGCFAVTLGRQQVRFGSGKLWNPLDILNPVSPTFVEGSDEQKGTDAVKFDFYPNDTTEITAVADLKKSGNEIEHFNLRDCNYLVRAKTSVRDADLAVMGGYVSRRVVAGFDVAAILFDGMARASAIASIHDRRHLFFQANAGYEYTFKKGVFILVEYFYNQRGVNYDTNLKAASIAYAGGAMDRRSARDRMYQAVTLGDGYPAAAMAYDAVKRRRGQPVEGYGTKSFRASLRSYNYLGRGQKTYLQLANEPLTLNQHYAAAAVAYDFHPLVRGELFVIGDIQGRGIFFGPTMKVNAYENLDFTIGMMGAITFGNRASDFSEYRKHYLFYASGSYVF